ncbi:fluoride efflux transporter CrcB [Kiloniella laminariae]|uniref:fluoride efflux transporter CrcB n=1 Tax=Kiloniella laminariae TaxID=454162 RepID=UPI0003808D6C|nr:fluoride efflux transporter CrcB [Kiloniella laminariae]
MKMLIAVAFGGAVGAVGRYLVYILMGSLVGSQIPSGTLAVNIVGSFVMGLLVPWLATDGSVPPEIRGLLTVGLLGAFTTFSTFAMDTFVLIERGAMVLAVVYVLLSVFLSITAFAGGFFMMRSFLA